MASWRLTVRILDIVLCQQLFQTQYLAVLSPTLPLQRRRCLLVLPQNTRHSLNNFAKIAALMDRIMSPFLPPFVLSLTAIFQDVAILIDASSAIYVLLLIRVKVFFLQCLRLAIRCDITSVRGLI